MLKNLQKELQAFGSFVVQESRKNLTKGGYKNKGHNVTRGLFNSLGYDEDENNGVYSIEWFMDEYGTFLDKGVKGARPSSVLIILKIKTLLIVIKIKDHQCSH